MAAATDRFDELDDRERLGAPFLASVALHGVLLASAVFLPAILNLGPHESWGGSTSGDGDAINATLVRSIPLPANPEATNVLATESKGLSHSEPKPVVKEPDAIKLPGKDAKVKPPKKQFAPTPVKPQPQPREVAQVDNQIPFGEGGPVSGPYGAFTAGATKGGFGFTGGAGDFGSKYAYYVDQVRRKVSENWLRYEVDPNISSARRVYVYFEITRDGSIANVKIEQSSGIPSLDQSAVRALQRIDTFGRLPDSYNGSRVSVEFWFDYKR